jgi:hypothetical protein
VVSSHIATKTCIQAQNNRSTKDDESSEGSCKVPKTAVFEQLLSEASTSQSRLVSDNNSQNSAPFDSNAMTHPQQPWITSIPELTPVCLELLSLRESGLQFFFCVMCHVVVLCAQATGHFASDKKDKDG